VITVIIALYTRGYKCNFNWGTVTGFNPGIKDTSSNFDQNRDHIGRKRASPVVYSPIFFNLDIQTILGGLTATVIATQTEVDRKELIDHRTNPA